MDYHAVIGKMAIFGCQFVKYSLMMILLIDAAGCAATFQNLEDNFDELIKMQRSPGEQSLALPDDVWRRNHCDQVKQPWFAMETFEVVPRRLSAGNDFNLRMTYALCSNKRADEIRGKLYTRIYYQGKAIVNDVKRGYSLKPERWQVDTFVTIPEHAKQGVYSVEVEFRSKLLKVNKSESFVVVSH